MGGGGGVWWGGGGGGGGPPPPPPRHCPERSEGIAEAIAKPVAARPEQATAS
jgi:hypothetical protein